MLYYKFLRNLVIKRLSIIDNIKYLTHLCGNLHENNRSIINASAKSVLYGIDDQKYMSLIGNQNYSYYFAFRGFLLLCYEPRYTYKNIVDILRKLEQLIKDGLIIKPSMKNIIGKSELWAIDIIKFE
jgi:hypothetical protein